MRNLTKKVVTLALAAAMVVSSITVNNTTATKAETVNTVDYAKNAVVTTSSNENGSLIGQNAVDGDFNTRWSSAFRDGEWIQLDFGKQTKISAIKIFWEAAYAKTYSISWSNDGSNWHKAVTWGMGNGSNLETTNRMYDVEVRYVRITCEERGTEYGVSIFEIQALSYEVVQDTTEAPTTEVPTTEAPTTVTSDVVDLAKSATATASSIEGAEYSANNAIDGNMNSRWSSAFRDGEYITLDLGSICNVGSIKIFWEDAFAKKYSIAWSQDGSTWNNAATSTCSVKQNDTVTMFYNRPVRYIRITCNERGTQYGVSIFEIEVMGTKTVAATEAATTVQETTTVAPTTTEAPTTVPETTTVKETVVTDEKPLEVIGAVVSTPKDNTIAVVWGQDAERINNHYRYNVYVNGVKFLSEVICNYYELENLGVGDAEVIIKSVLNGVESTGVKFNVTVTGELSGNNVALGSTATATNESGNNYASNLVDGDYNKIWTAQALFPTATIDLGRVVKTSSLRISWPGDYDAPKGFSYFYSVDGVNWKLGTNVDKMNFKYIDVISLNVEARYFSFSMGRYSNLAHFYAIREIEIFD